jgi:hypothetical protein
MEMKTIVTTERKCFAKHVVPLYGRTYIPLPKIPSNIEFGKTYYAYDRDGNRLTAFKLLAVSFCPIGNDSRTVCYIKLPLEHPMWYAHFFDTFKIFKSGKDFTDYIMTGNGQHKVTFDVFTCDANDDDGCGFAVKKTYRWDKRANRPVLVNSLINHLFITKDCTYVGYSNEYRGEHGTLEKGYATAEDCIRANMSGLEIVEFDEPSEIDINLDLENCNGARIKYCRNFEFL